MYILLAWFLINFLRFFIAYRINCQFLSMAFKVSHSFSLASLPIPLHQGSFVNYHLRLIVLFPFHNHSLHICSGYLPPLPRFLFFYSHRHAENPDFSFWLKASIFHEAFLTYSNLKFIYKVALISLFNI